MPTSPIKKKRFTGKRIIKRRVYRELIRDSYQADKTALQKLRSISKVMGVSKASLLRWATEIIIAAWNAREKGKKTFTIELDSKMQKGKRGSS